VEEKFFVREEGQSEESASKICQEFVKKEKNRFLRQFRVARFFLVQFTNTGKNLPNGQNIYVPNERKIFPKAIK
jgi:hypothetical protein